MTEPKVTEVWLVFDELAVPGMQWWARVETQGGDDPFPVMATGLCNSAAEALEAMTLKLARWVEASAGEECPAQ